MFPKRLQIVKDKLRSIVENRFAMLSDAAVGLAVWAIGFIANLAYRKVDATFMLLGAAGMIVVAIGFLWIGSYALIILPVRSLCRRFIAHEVEPTVSNTPRE